MQNSFSGMQKVALGLGALCVFGAAPAPAAETAARVTAAVGSTNSEGSAVDPRGGLQDGDDLETGEDGNCSLLVDEDALVEVCGNTSLRLERKEGQPDGPRVVNLDQGEVRLVVEPRLAGERIEIHTPAAIATLMGTIVYVSVDALGVTTVTSAASQVMVESSDTAVPGKTMIDAGQQIVIRPGEAPPQQPTAMRPEALKAMGGCLIDFHGAALNHDRGQAANDKVDEVVEQDVAEAELPQVAQAAAENALIDTQLGDTQDDLTDNNVDPPNNVVDNITQAGGDPSAPPGVPQEPDPPGGECPPGLPGEGCGF
jgi:hypothetical protein